jgi:ATP-binding cassette subfamily B protein
MAERQNQKPAAGFHGPRPGHNMASGEKARNFSGTVRRLFKQMSGYKLALGAVLVFAVGSTVFSIVGPKVLSHAITALFEGLVAKYAGTGGIDFTQIGQILLFLLGLYFLAALFNFVQGFIMAGVSQKVCFTLRGSISEKIHRMPFSYFESRPVGEVLSRITNDVDTLGQGMSQSITQFITSVVMVLGVLVMMLTISPLMTLIALAILPVSLGLIALVMRFSLTHFRTQQAYLGKINSQVEETIGAQQVVKLFNYETEAESQFAATNEVLFTSAWKSQFISGLMQPLMMFIGNLGYVGVVVSGGVLAFAGRITVGDIQAFIQYVRNFTQPISQMAQVLNQLQSMAAAAERVFEFLDEAEEEPDAAVSVSAAGIRGAVDFAHVRFGYTPEQDVIHDFNGRVEPGRMVAVVGPTGAGKTTMVKLLLRFYDVSGGVIRIDGHDLRDFRRGDLRGCFGMVLQDTWLFKGTIRDNIRYGRLEAGEAEIIAAARAARVHHFIQTLPGGYDMELNEDSSNISQGQKQLLTIARAILADRPILILDEATSSVDTRTEVEIQNAMHNLMQGRTSFVIAHRLSTIKGADLILVMQNGDIVEQGRHEELLQAGGVYAELYNSQFEEGEE